MMMAMARNEGYGWHPGTLAQRHVQGSPQKGNPAYCTQLRPCLALPSGPPAEVREPLVVLTSARGRPVRGGRNRRSVRLFG